MIAYPLMLTVELEENWDGAEYYGLQRFIVIRLGSHEVKRIEVRFHVYPGDRETLEQYAAEWLAGLDREQEKAP